MCRALDIHARHQSSLLALKTVDIGLIKKIVNLIFLYLNSTVITQFFNGKNTVLNLNLVMDICRNCQISVLFAPGAIIKTFKKTGNQF